MNPPADHESEPNSDEVLEPDAVTSGHDARQSASTGDDVFDLEDLAQRAVDVLFSLLGRAKLLARGVLIFAAVTCLLGFGLGLAALSGGARTVWLLIGGFFTVISIGAVLVALLRLGAVRRGGEALVDEVRTLMSGDLESERTVVETVESTEGAQDDGIVKMSQQFFSLKDAVSGHTSNFAALSLALSSITSFPGLMALATVIGFGMLAIAGIFGLILIF